MIIESQNNNTLKSFAKLKEKKFRDESGRYLIEGMRSVVDSLPYIREPEVLLSQSAFEKYSSLFSTVNCYVCTDRLFDRVCQTKNAQGVICSAKKSNTIPKYEEKYALLLDRIRDPGNMGTIIRTALATGFKDIYCIDCVDPYNPKVVRSAMSAVSRVNIYVSLDEIVVILKGKGYKLFCADMGGENLFNRNLSFDKACLAVGNEANGLSTNIITSADEVLCLPMCEGESLNAGVCAAIFMYEMAFGMS